MIRQRILDNIAFVKEKYLKNGEILLENLDYNPKDKSGAYEYVCDPDFIDGILVDSGCRMLLDIGHAHFSAQNMGHDNVIDFIYKLPLEKVAEIGVTLISDDEVNKLPDTVLRMEFKDFDKI